MKVEGPDNAAQWQLRLQMTFLYPKQRIGEAHLPEQLKGFDS